MSFVSELKRRKVFQVAAVYLVVAWLIMQVVDVVNEPLRLPEWFATVAILIVAIGFPIALILSWAFDLTPEGVVKDTGTVQSGGRRMEYVFAGLLVIAVATLLYREFTPSEPAVEVVAEETQRDVLPNSIAVLPFENLSPDPDNDYFAAGIHESTLNQLAKIRDLTVIARTSVLQYEDDPPPIPEIAEALKVEMVMEGSVRYASDRVLITVQLIDGNTGAHIWSEEYNRDLTDIFGVQGEIAENIAMAMEAELLPVEQRSIAERPTESGAAFALYLKARALVPNLSSSAPPDFYDALNQALVLDPDFALARATLAFVYGRALGEAADRIGSVAEAEARVREHAQRALDLDPKQGLAYAALASIDEAYWRVSESGVNWEKALVVTPNDPDVLDEATKFYAFTGQLEKARPLAARAQILNPANSAITQLWLHLGNKNYDGMVAVIRQAADDPVSAGNPSTHMFLALAEALRGANELALDELRLFEELDPDSGHAGNVSSIIYAYGRIGRTDDAQRMFNRFQDLANDERLSKTVTPMSHVWANLGIGADEEALRWLNLSARNSGPENSLWRAPLVRNLLSDPILDQPEFVEVRRRLGFRE